MSKRKIVDTIWNTVEGSRNLFLIMVIFFGIIIWIQKCNNEERSNKDKKIYEKFKKDFFY